MKRIFMLFFLLLNLNTRSSFTQISLHEDDSTDYDIYGNTERLLHENDIDAEDSDLMDYLDDLRRKPVDLNTADRSLLLSLPFMSPALAESMIRYRTLHGPFDSKRGLLKIEGFTQQLYESVRPFVTAKRRTGQTEVARKILSAQFRTLFLQDLHTRKGYLTKVYPGNKLRSASKFTVSYEAKEFTLEGGLASDKDPGETKFNDFMSYFASYSGKGVIRNITLGHYRASFGCGLAMSNTLMQSKTADIAGKVSSRGGIRPYASAGESGFLFGGAGTFILLGAELTAFYSSRGIDASVDSLTGNAKSIYGDGYHRTAGEMSRKNSMGEKLSGLRAEARPGRFRIGGMYFETEYSRTIDPDTVRKLNGLSGNKYKAVSLDAVFARQDGEVFGEVVYSLTGNYGFLAGATLSAGRTADASFMVRRFPFNFYSPFGSVVSERKPAGNETGLFAALKLKLFGELSVRAFFDQFSFPYRSYTMPVPSRGNEFAAEAEYRLTGRTLLMMRYSDIRKEELIKIQRPGIYDRKRRTFRLGFEINEDGLRIRGRYEHCSAGTGGAMPGSKGNLFFTDVTAEPIRFMTFSARVIFFNTDDYDSRIYEFENDVAGVMTNVALYGKGVRWYILASLKPFPALKLRIKYAETAFMGVNKTGSGNDEVRGNINNRLSVSLEAMF